MARIRGVDLPRSKRGVIGLTYIYGIGRSTAEKILLEAEVDQSIKVEEWDDAQLTRIREIINERYKTECELRGEVQSNVKRLMDIGCLRGLRHRRSLPVRGQRTRTNARTRKGRKKTVANKKKAVK